MSIRIRQALPEDAPQVQALYDVLTGKPSHVLPSRLAELAADNRSFLFVAEEANNVVGSAFLTLCPDPMYGTQPFAVVENIVVASLKRNSGVGTALMRHIESRCLEHNCSKIMLMSATERVNAHRFFSRLGYEAKKKVGFVKYRSSLATEAQQGAPDGRASLRSARR